MFPKCSKCILLIFIHVSILFAYEFNPDIDCKIIVKTNNGSYKGCQQYVGTDSLFNPSEPYRRIFTFKVSKNKASRKTIPNNSQRNISRLKPFRLRFSKLRPNKLRLSRLMPHKLRLSKLKPYMLGFSRLHRLGLSRSEAGGGGTTKLYTPL